MLKVKSFAVVSKDNSLKGWYKLEPINHNETVMFLCDKCNMSDWSFVNGDIYVRDSSLLQLV